MNRYTNYYELMEVCEDGEWVTSSDHDAEVERLRVLLAKLVEEVGCGREVWEVRGTSAYVDAKLEVDCNE
jgi:hypothetical protein